MDARLLSLISDTIPKMNPVILAGIAARELKKVEEYVDSLIRHAESSFPPGLKYMGMRKLTPSEEYIEITRLRNSKSQYETARSDIYMVQLEFRYEDLVIKKIIYLPFCRKGSILSIRGSTFSISPVLADKGISLGSDDAFIRISKAPINFRRERVHFLVDGETKTPNVTYAWLHNRNRKAGGRNVLKMNTMLVHYLFSKYGVVETFRRFQKTDIRIGNIRTVTNKLFPEKDWVICTSIGIKPKSFKFLDYIPTDLAIAVRRCDFDLVCESMVAGIFYIADNFTNAVRASELDGSKHEIRMWRILLGKIIGGVTSTDNSSIIEAMNEHMESIDSYIDAGAKAVLAKGEVFVNDIYELLYRMIVILATMIANSSAVLSCLYDKHFVVLEYLLKDINNNINNVNFKLIKRRNKGELKPKDIDSAIKSSIKFDSVTKISNGQRHGEVTSISYPGDNMFFKITSNVCSQVRSGGSGSSNNSIKSDKSSFLHASLAEVGSVCVLPKSDPTGRTRISPWVNIDEEGNIIRNPENFDLIENTQKYFNRQD